MMIISPQKTFRYNKNSTIKHTPVDAPKKEQDYIAGIEAKFETLFDAADRFGVETLIIPDIGCGVFGNKPHKVGGCLSRVIGRRVGGTVKKVILTGDAEFQRAARMEKGPSSTERSMVNMSRSMVESASGVMLNVLKNTFNGAKSALSSDRSCGGPLLVSVAGTNADDRDSRSRENSKITGTMCYTYAEALKKGSSHQKAPSSHSESTSSSVKERPDQEDVDDIPQLDLEAGRKRSSAAAMDVEKNQEFHAEREPVSSSSQKNPPPAYGVWEKKPSAQASTMHRDNDINDGVIVPPGLVQKALDMSSSDEGEDAGSHAKMSTDHANVSCANPPEVTVVIHGDSALSSSSKTEYGPGDHPAWGNGSSCFNEDEIGSGGGFVFDDALSKDANSGRTDSVRSSRVVEKHDNHGKRNAGTGDDHQIRSRWEQEEGTTGRKSGGPRPVGDISGDAHASRKRSRSRSRSVSCSGDVVVPLQTTLRDARGADPSARPSVGSTVSASIQISLPPELRSFPLATGGGGFNIQLPRLR